MKKSLRLCLLLSILFLCVFAGAQNASAADYVCANAPINPDNPATGGDRCNNQCDSSCNKACGADNPPKDFNGQWDNNSSKCFWFFLSPQQYGLCGCKLKQCKCDKANHQIICDEGRTPGGSNTCNSGCDCTEGRGCVNGICQDIKPNCRQQYRFCLEQCGGVPIGMKGNCDALCGGDLNTCR